jgi:SNF2 family DNA or RNA helicase
MEELPIPAAYPHLVEVRGKPNVSLKPSAAFQTTILDDSGEASDFHLRNYQSIGVYNLLSMKRFMLGDDTGLGKTIQVLACLAYLYDTDPKHKVIICAPKSALPQWQKEMSKFLTKLRGVRVSGTVAQREKVYDEFFYSSDESHFALILNYHILMRDWPIIEKGIQRIKGKDLKLCTIFDEATAFKTTNTKTHEISKLLSETSDRVYGLTATLLKNNLMEGYGIFRILIPGLFRTKTSFLNDYCITKLQRITGGRKIPIVVAYKNLKTFRARIDPYFLGRLKYDVSDELPQIITKRVDLELSKEQEAKYDEALSGLLETGTDIKETTKLTSMIYCQQIVDSLALIGLPSKDSPKEEEFFRLINEELQGEKVIVFTNFRKFVDHLGSQLEEKKIPYCRITGAEDEADREEARIKFQDVNSGTNIILITNAASEALNLQTASAMIFLDAPWSYGQYKQLLGRMVRIGSKHTTVLAIHLVMEGTIDNYVLKTLKKKKEIIDPLLGGSSDTLNFDSKSEAKDIYESLRSDAEARKHHG